MVLIAYGYYNDRIAPRDDVVFQIGERQYSYAYLEDRVQSDVAQGRFNLSDTLSSVTATIARIQREELTRIIGLEQGITVSDEELDAGIRDDLNLSAEITRNELGPILGGELLRIDLSLDEYLTIIESQVIEDKVRDQIEASLPQETEQVDLLFIEAGSQANAIQARQAFEDGAEFAEVAAQFSAHSSSGERGILGWTPREALDPELADVAFSLTGRSGIIETEQNFYIIEVLGKEVRPIDPAIAEDFARDEFNQLLEASFHDTQFIYNLSDSQLIDLASAIGGTFG